jgi:hypothetical protein
VSNSIACGLETTMRILSFVATALVLAACSPADHAAGHKVTPTPGEPSASPPTTPASPGGRPASPGETSASPEANAGAHTVTFAIGGTARRTSVAYTTPSGQRLRGVVSPPWSKTFTMRQGQSLDVSAHSDAGGTLTCTLKVDGELVKNVMSSGDSMTVDCGHTLGS